MLSKILVPTDFSKAAERALEAAFVLAPASGATVKIVHQLATPIPVFSAMTQPGGSWKDVGASLEDFVSGLRLEAEKAVESLAEKAPEGISVETAVLDEGEPADVVVESAASWGADLIVLGTHGRQGLDRLVMGSVAMRVLHHAEAPVMLLREETKLFDASKLGGVLVPVDFSDYSQRALGLARELASVRRGKLHVMHVAELLHTPFEPGGLTSPFEKDPAQREKSQDALEDMLGDSEGDVTIAEGTSVPGEILWWREKLGASLVVMGSRGQTGLRNLLVGSVAETVARYSEVPVVVVK